MSVVGAGRARKRALSLVLLLLAALACVLLALAAGASRAHWLPVAGFLAIAATGAACFWVDLRMTRRRAWRQRQRQAEFPWGIRYGEPLWMPLMKAMVAVGIGALLAAIPAAVGFPSVGVGVLLCFGVIGFMMSAGFGPRALSFEAAGVRFHVRGGTFVVPWTTIANVERIGPDHSLMIRLHVHDANLVVDSHEPKRPRVRTRVEFCVARNNGGGGLVMLMPWAAGLDGPTLARTIDAAMRGKPDPVN